MTALAEPTQRSILEQLEYLIFDDHKLISYKWVTNHFKVHIQTSKEILSHFVDKHENKLWIHHCITGYRSLSIPHSDSNTNNNNNNNNNVSPKASSVFTIFVVSDEDLKTTKDSFDTITSTHIHSVAIKQTQTMNDFYGAQYQADYQQQRDAMTYCLASQGSNNAPSVQSIPIWSDITNNQVRGMSSPHLNRALGRTKQEEKQLNLKNKNNKKLSFKQKIDKLNTQNTQTPLKAKFNNLQIQKDENKNKNNNKNEAKSESTSSSNTGNTNAKSNKKSGIAACFAKAATLNKQQPKKPENAAQDPKPIKKKKADDITNFFGVENGCKDKIESKKIANKKERKKKTKKKKKKSKKQKGSIEPARKRKRGEMEADNNLAPIDFDSESSESEHEMDVEYGVSDDEELEQLTSRRHNVAKRRKIMDSEDDENDEDDDIDLEQDSKAKTKKLSKRQLEKQREKEQKQKLLSQRRNNFFGRASGNQLRKVKKYKKIQKTHINEKGMFVTEDVEVTDDEDCEEKDAVNATHKHQHMVKEGNGGNDGEKDDDDDVDMMGGNQKKEEIKTKGKKKKKNNSKKAVKPKGKKKTGKKNGSITSFFKVK